MHPSFQNLFVHPKSFRPLTFFGNVKDGRWTNGFLWSSGGHETYPVIDGIPVFIPPYDLTSPEISEELREERREKKWGPERAWETAGTWIREKSPMAEFAKRIAESEGLILEIASGPGGGFAPAVLRINPEAKILMDDVRLTLLQDWQEVLRDRGVPNASFAVFDAREMSIKNESMDIVEEAGGFGNIDRCEEAIKEAYRILKPGGTLFSLNLLVNREDFLKLSEEVRARWLATYPCLSHGQLEAFKRVGFKIISNTPAGEREVEPGDTDLWREVSKYGVVLHIRFYFTEAFK